MNKKIGLLLILVFGSFLIVAIIYYVFYFSVDDSLPQEELGTEDVSQVSDSIKRIELAKTEELESEKIVAVRKMDTPMGQANLERMARSFAERFGSFSNQSNFSNITDLKMVMSEDMQSWADAYIEKNRKTNLANDVYYGLTSKALSTEVEKFNDSKGEAVIRVETRRREAMGTTNNASKLFSQEILITFIKENKAWRVDSAYWQD